MRRDRRSIHSSSRSGCTSRIPDRTLERILPTGAAQLIINLKEDETRLYDPDFPHRCMATAGAADNAVMHAEIMVGDSLVMLGQTGGQWTPRTAALYRWVEDVDATYAKALQAGATSESAPEDKRYGHPNAGVIDRNGVTWWIGAPVK